MISLLGDLTRNLIIVVFINVLLEMLLPQGQFHRYIRMVTGLVVIMLVVNSLSVLLGRAPEGLNAEPAAALSRSGDLQNSPLLEINRQRTIELYRDSLYRLVRDEIESRGQWVLIEANFELEEAVGSELYGALYRVEAVVKDATAAGAGEVEPVEINPVEAGGPASDESTGSSSYSGRLPEMEETLSRLLQLPKDAVTVTVINSANR